MDCTGYVKMDIIFYSGIIKGVPDYTARRNMKKNFYFNNSRMLAEVSPVVW